MRMKLQLRACKRDFRPFSNNFAIFFILLKASFIFHASQCIKSVKRFKQTQRYARFWEIKSYPLPDRHHSRKKWSIQGFCNICTVWRRSSRFGIGGECNLFIDHDVSSPSNGVVRNSARMQCLIDHTLPCKTSISMNQYSQVFLWGNLSVWTLLQIAYPPDICS